MSKSYTQMIIPTSPYNNTFFKPEIVEEFVHMISIGLTNHKILMGKVSEKNIRNVILTNETYPRVDASYNLILVVSSTFLIQHHAKYYSNTHPLCASVEDLLQLFPSFHSSHSKGISVEIEVLLKFTNVMNYAVRIFTPTKKFLLDIVSYVVERKLRAYSTGGGANAQTERRLEIIEKVLALNGVNKVKRNFGSSSVASTPSRPTSRRTENLSPFTVNTNISNVSGVDGVTNYMQRMSTSSVLTIDTSVEPSPGIAAQSFPTPSTRRSSNTSHFFPIRENEEGVDDELETVGSTASLPLSFQTPHFTRPVAAPFPPMPNTPHVCTVGMFNPCHTVSDLSFTFSNLVSGVDQIGQCVIQSNCSLIDASIDMSVTPSQVAAGTENVTISFTFVRSSTTKPDFTPPQVVSEEPSATHVDVDLDLFDDVFDGEQFLSIAQDLM